MTWEIFMAFDFDMIERFYKSLPETIDSARVRLDKPLTLAEKIL